MKIDHHVPLPAPVSQELYPFKHLKPLDSVFIEGQDSRGKAATAAKVYALRQRKRGFKFRVATRAVEENGVRGVRIWRVE